MLNPFSYLRAAARNAVLGGIQDALAEAAPSLDVLAVAGGPAELPALPPRAEPAEEPAAKKPKAVKSGA